MLIKAIFIGFIAEVYVSANLTPLAQEIDDFVYGPHPNSTITDALIEKMQNGGSVPDGVNNDFDHVSRIQISRHSYSLLQISLHPELHLQRCSRQYGEAATSSILLQNK
jgi:hypothetical protein